MNPRIRIPNLRCNGTTACLILAVMLPAANVHGQKAESSAFATRLIPVKQGHFQNFDGDRSRLAKTPAFQAGDRMGLDMESPTHPLIHFSYENGWLFFLFYNDIENAFGDRPYVIQRMRKTVKDYADPEDTQPVVTTTYQVEAMKTRNGSLKGGGDQHFGHFGLGPFYKREIIKDFEIGYGDIKGVTSGEEWPFADDALFHVIQNSTVDDSVYKSVAFREATKWTLAVSFDRARHYSIAIPELGIDAPVKLPDPNHAMPKRDPATTSIVLEEGLGVLGLRAGQSRLEDIRNVFGEPIYVERANAKAKNYSYNKGIQFHVYDDGPIKTISTLPSFAGKTSKGTKLGDTRSRVFEAYGVPNEVQEGRRVQRVATYGGVCFWFDFNDCVETIVVWEVTPQRP